MNTFFRTTAVLLLGLSLAMPTASHGQGDRDAALEEAAAQLAGDRISLNLVDVDLPKLLAMLAKVRRINIVAGPDVRGEVSLTLFDVPFDDALDAILGVAGFTHFMQGNVLIVVAEDQKAELPPHMDGMEYAILEIQHTDPNTMLDSVREFMSANGSASVIGMSKIMVHDSPQQLRLLRSIIQEIDTPPNDTFIYEINHVQPGDVLKTITEFLSPSGKATLTMEGQLVVQDSRVYVDVIEAILDQLDVPPRQVLISAKILAVVNNGDTNIGTELLSSTGRFAGDLPSATGFVENTARFGSAASNGFFALIVRDHEKALLSALSTSSDVQTLSAPQLIAVDGTAASIQVGERLGFRVTTTTETSSLESVEFLDVGTLLDITPHITNDGLVRLIVHPEVSAGVIDAEGLPSERTTQATTEMIVRDGETVIIGGLIDYSEQKTRKGVPVLSNIPIFGFLFGDRGWVDAKTEIVILVTPYIVGPEATPEMVKESQRVNEWQESMSDVRSDTEMLTSDIRERRKKR